MTFAQILCKSAVRAAKQCVPAQSTNFGRSDENHEPHLWMLFHLSFKFSRNLYRISFKNIIVTCAVHGNRRMKVLSLAISTIHRVQRSMHKLS